jgi:hypothetical protein
MNRRAFLLGMGASTIARAEAPVSLPILFSVAENEAGAPVVHDQWIAEQLGYAGALYEPLGIRFKPSYGKAHTAPLMDVPADRDKLAAFYTPRVIQIFVVIRLIDDVDPKRHRRGVHWRYQADKSKRWIILSSRADPEILTHELGHYFGLGHNEVMNNVMSYHRNGGELFFDDGQKTKIRAQAAFLARAWG